MTSALFSAAAGVVFLCIPAAFFGFVLVKFLSSRDAMIDPSPEDESPDESNLIEVWVTQNTLTVELLDPSQGVTECRLVQDDFPICIRYTPDGDFLLYCDDSCKGRIKSIDGLEPAVYVSRF